MDPTIKSVGGIGGKYVRRKVAELASDPANVRKHNEKNLDAIKASLTRFGQQKPIVIDKSGVVRAGNGTLAAAKALGWAEIDCVERPNWKALKPRPTRLPTTGRLSLPNGTRPR